MSRVVVRGGTVVDERGSFRSDVLIEDGVIAAVEPDIDEVGASVVDAGGCSVIPGLVDLHVHLREPGREEAETIESGARTAALGGYTAIVAMPNTEPTVDSDEVVEFVQRKAKSALTDVAVAASITLGREGTTLSPMVELARLGVRMFTDDGDGVQSAGVMRRALEYASMLDVTIAQHCEDATLSHGGLMHEGAVSSLLGIPGWPVEAEEAMVQRDILLNRMTGTHVHFMHLSSAGSVAMVRAAKAQGLRVTAEAAPHHFTLSDDELFSFDPEFKVNPPIRSVEHRDAVREGLRDGTIDAIATDHAPHVPHLKELAFEEAACGMLGLQTAFALAVTELDLPLERLVALMSSQPAKIARLSDTHGGPVERGRAANLAVVDVDTDWTVGPDLFRGRSRNTPFIGRKVRGRVRHTLLRGEPVVLDGEAQR